MLQWRCLYSGGLISLFASLHAAQGADLFGHARARLTMVDDGLWGAEQQTGDWYVTHRYHLGSSFERDNLSGLVELAAAFDHGAEGGTSPVDENRLSVHRAWLEGGSKETIALRFGRDEWSFGSGRLVNKRDGTNVRRRFDGLMALHERAGLSVRAFAGFETENDPGTLDDDIAKGKSLWGLYATEEQVFGGLGAVDLYYLGFRDKNAVFSIGPGRELRHSLGTRLFGEAAGWDWDIEGVYQFGSVDLGPDTARISAWTVASTIGRTFSALPLKPRLAVSANVASGDRDTGDRHITGFNALFPRGSYFSDLAHLGPRNFYNLNPYLTLSLNARMKVTVDSNLFWRYAKADGVYAPNGREIAAPDPSAPRLVDVSTSVNFEYQVTDGLFFGAIYTRSSPKGFIKVVRDDAKGTDFIELTLRQDF